MWRLRRRRKRKEKDTGQRFCIRLDSCTFVIKCVVLLFPRLRNQGRGGGQSESQMRTVTRERGFLSQHRSCTPELGVITTACARLASQSKPDPGPGRGGGTLSCWQLVSGDFW